MLFNLVRFKFALKEIVTVCMFILLVAVVFSGCNKERTRKEMVCTVSHKDYLKPKTINQNFIVGSDTSLWNKDTLKVFFYDGSDLLKAKVLRLVKEWTRPSGIHFQNEDDISLSDIRVTFAKGGFYSLIGTNANMYPMDTTMWLEKLEDYTETDQKSCVLHEFGHTLGLYHELQNPNVNIPWDKPAVYKYYKMKEDWDPDEVDEWVFKKIHTTRVSEFDSTSIMIYAVPNFMTLGDYEIAWPSQLSKLDRIKIAQWYSELRDLR